MSLRDLQLANAGRRFEKVQQEGLEVKARKDWHFKLFKNPPENMSAIAQAGARKAEMPIPKLIALGIMGGVYVGFGAAVAATVAGGLDPAWVARFPGIQKLIAGFLFPIALVFILIVGGELFTGNVMYMVVGILAGTVKVWRALVVLFISLVTNYLGTVIVAGLSVHYAEYMMTEPWKSYLAHLGDAKVKPGFGVLILKGIPANMLVNLAILMAYAAEDVTGKILSMYLSISTFAVTGFEHLIANEAYFHFMFFNAPHASLPYGLWLWKNFIAVLIGNTIGAAALGIVYWFVYLDNTIPARAKWITTWNCCCPPKPKANNGAASPKPGLKRPPTSGVASPQTFSLDPENN